MGDSTGASFHYHQPGLVAFSSREPGNPFLRQFEIKVVQFHVITIITQGCISMQCPWDELFTWNKKIKKIKKLFEIFFSKW